MEVKDYYGGIEKLDDAIRALTLGAKDIITRLREVRRLYLQDIWQENVPGDMWYDIKHMCSRIDDEQLAETEAVHLADNLLKMRLRLEAETSTTPQHTWV